MVILLTYSKLSDLAVLADIASEDAAADNIAIRAFQHRIQDLEKENEELLQKLRGNLDIIK